MRWIPAIAMLLVSVTARSQEIYLFQPMTAADCYGILYDSDEGDNAAYGHNEDRIFKICVPGARSITIAFDSFCTEPVEDFLCIYDGSDTTASRLAKLHGSTTPGTYTSSGNCLTFYFHSDKSVACFGWKILWETEIEPPKAPVFLRSPEVSCESASVGVRFDRKFNCDSIRDSSFMVTGVLNPMITSVTPVNCDGNNETDSFIVNLDRNLDRGGSYRVDFTYVHYDACDSPWVLDTFVYFNITDCPIEVDLTATDDTICLGSCTYLNAVITGGDSTQFQYTWSPSAPSGSPPYRVCPVTTTTYVLRVADGTAIPGSDSVTVHVVSPPQTMNDTSVCYTGNSFQLTASPTGGTWQGKGVDSISGNEYNPYQAGPGLDTVVYFFGGCTDTLLISVQGTWAGYDQAACPGSGPFPMTGFSPSGGYWTGQNIDSQGIFTPTDTGSYTVTYHWNGCSHNKKVNVYPVSVPDYDTFCLSDPIQTLSFTPFGGRWYGRGIVNSVYGYFNPAVAGPGNHLLQYWTNGCRDTMYVHVIAIDARYNEISCPDEGPILVVPAVPAGGYWTGMGITDSLTGAYDASFVYDLNRTWYNDTLHYHVNGCVDFKIMYVRRTVVYRDTLHFCIEEEPLLLDWYSVMVTPGGGTWSGPGINGNYFNPSMAGYGIHKLYYRANGCGDSLVMVVYPQSVIQGDTGFCITDPAYTFYNPQGNGYFNGAGVVNPTSGVFDPATAGIGDHVIYYFSEYGCRDSFTVSVYGRPAVSIIPPDPFYCLKDSLFQLSGNPAGGTWSGPGVTGDFLNPELAGSGNHTVYYTYGRPNCTTTRSAAFRVTDTLKVELTADRDTLCHGEDVLLRARGTGGVEANYHFSWNTGDNGVSNLIKSPVQSTAYIAVLSDGCSNPAVDTLHITVHPRVQVDLTTSPIRCYGETGFALVTPLSAAPHSVTWQTSPVVTDHRLNAQVSARYFVTVVNDLTGCRLDTSAIIPGYDKIQAAFRTSPGGDHCLNPFDPVVHIINQSTGGISGAWDFGDGTVIPYDPAFNPVYTYEPDTTAYVIKLRIENEGGCADSMERLLCVDDAVYLFAPTAFSPDGNGINDHYRVYAANVVEFEIRIYNRWGQCIFYDDRADFSWDGTYQGEKVMEGLYKYVIQFKGRKTPRKMEQGVLVVVR